MAPRPDPVLFSVIVLELSFTVYLGVTLMMEVHFHSIILINNSIQVFPFTQTFKFVGMKSRNTRRGNPKQKHLSILPFSPLLHRMISEYWIHPLH